MNILQDIKSAISQLSVEELAVFGEWFDKHYSIDEKGNRVGRLPDVEDYNRSMEELESIRAYEAAKASGDEVIPFDQAVAEMERDC